MFTHVLREHAHVLMYMYVHADGILGYDCICTVNVWNKMYGNRGKWATACVLCTYMNLNPQHTILYILYTLRCDLHCCGIVCLSRLQEPANQKNIHH